MSRLLAHAPVPARALDALDVTRARRNGRKARRNCGCGPGCGCAPCMAKWGPPAKNPALSCHNCGHAASEHAHYKGRAGPAHCTVRGCFCTASPESIRAWRKKHPTGSLWENPRRNGNILVADTYPGKPKWSKRKTLDLSPVARTMFTGNDPSGGRGTTTHTSWIEPAEQPAARDAYKRVEAFVSGLPKSELVRLLREVGARHAYVEERADSLRASLHNILYERIVPFVRANGTVGGLVAGAATMHVAHRAGWMKNGHAARRNHHLRVGDRVRFKGAAGQGFGTGVVVREVDPARDLYAVQWEGGQRHASIDGHLLVKVLGNPAKDSYYVILVDTSGREHMIGPMKLRDAKDRLRREEDKGYIPDGTGGRTLLKYGSGFVKHASAVLSSALLKYRNPR